MKFYCFNNYPSSNKILLKLADKKETVVELIFSTLFQLYNDSLFRALQRWNTGLEDRKWRQKILAYLFNWHIYSTGINSLPSSRKLLLNCTVSSTSVIPTSSLSWGILTLLVGSVGQELVSSHSDSLLHKTPATFMKPFDPVNFWSTGLLKSATFF